MRGQVIDQVLCTLQPRAVQLYRGGQAELHCHGAPMVLSLGLEALFAQGPARQARGVHPAGLPQRTAGPGPGGGGGRPAGRPEPGGARQAAGQLSGALSHRIVSIYSALVDVMAHFHAVLDYPDEDIDPFTQERLARDLDAQRQAPGGPAVHLPAGPPPEPGREMRHRGAAQRG